MKAIADTGFVVAFLNRDDRYHDWASELGRGVSDPLLTCEAVLAETAFKVESVDRVLALLQDGFLKVAFDLTKNVEEVLELAERYRDRTPDLADLCLIRMSELYDDLPVLTVDESDFRTYRRNRREIIPIVCPPQVSRRKTTPRALCSGVVAHLPDALIEVDFQNGLVGTFAAVDRELLREQPALSGSQASRTHLFSRRSPAPDTYSQERGAIFTAQR